MMRAKPAYRDRDETEVAVLDALADRTDEGMTVLAIRSAVDVDIDALEMALANLKRDDLIVVSKEGGRTVITVEDHVVGTSHPENGQNVFGRLRRRFFR